MTSPFYIPPNDQSMVFPDVELSLKEPDGLLAVGGDLSPERLFSAYSQGIFPWFSDDQPILWWSPDPRMILLPSEIKLSRSLKKTLRKTHFRVTYDCAFSEVLEACSQPREKQADTWITEDMKLAYNQLFHQGIAHSFECWEDDQLIGGLYGVAIGSVFFGESMFSIRTDASKIAFAHSMEYLKSWEYALIDCQVESDHLSRFGARNISRQLFIQKINHLTKQTVTANAWQAKN